MGLDKRLTWFLGLAFACCSQRLLGLSDGHSSRSASHARRGLHATLHAEHEWSGDGQLETLSFQLINDSAQTLDSATASWVLVINGRPAPDPGGQLWLAGGKPTGGYDTVRPGSGYQFGKGLPFREYFPEARDYKVYWRAAGFRSNIVVVRGQPTP